MVSVLAAAGPMLGVASHGGPSWGRLEVHGYDASSSGYTHLRFRTPYFGVRDVHQPVTW